MNSKSQIIRKNLFSGEGQIKLEWTDEELKNFQKHLDSQKIPVTYDKGSKLSKVEKALLEEEILTLIRKGVAPLTVSKLVNKSRVYVINVVINHKYSQLLLRSRETQRLLSKAGLD